MWVLTRNLNHDRDNAIYEMKNNNNEANIYETTGNTENFIAFYLDLEFAAFKLCKAER